MTLALALALAPTAAAQSFVVQADHVVSGGSSPSVVHDGAVYTMAYEVSTRPPSRCAEGFAIQLATSTDGITFTPTTRYGSSTTAPCGVRAPGLAWTDDGHLVMAYEAVQRDGTARIGVQDRYRNRATTRILPELDGLSEPSLARFDGVWRMLAVDPVLGVVSASSPDLRVFVVDPTPEVALGATPWSADGIDSVALGCVDDAGWPWEAYYGGWTGAETGWARLVSNAAGAWYVTAPFDLWSDDSAWSGWDFVTDGARTAVYYDWTDLGGATHIGVTVSGGAMPNPAALRGRDCRG